MDHPEAIQFKFTPEELTLLEQQKLQWQAADRKERRIIASDVYEALKKTNPGWDTATKKLKKQVCSLLFQNPFLGDPCSRAFIGGSTSTAENGVPVNASTQ